MALNSGAVSIAAISASEYFVSGPSDDPPLVDLYSSTSSSRNAGAAPVSGECRQRGLPSSGPTASTHTLRSRPQGTSHPRGAYRCSTGHHPEDLRDRAGEFPSPTARHPRSSLPPQGARSRVALEAAGRKICCRLIANISYCLFSRGG